MARGSNSVPTRVIDVNLPEPQVIILEELLRGGLLGATSVASLANRIVSAVLSQGGFLDVRRDVERILNLKDKEKQD